MLKMTASVLAAALLVAGFGVSAADAKTKKAKAKKEAAAACAPSANMRDESKFHTCFPMQAKK